MVQAPDRRLGWKLVAIAGFVVVTISLVACGKEPPPAPTATPEVEPSPTSAAEGRISAEVLSRGAELYAANCQVCHGDQAGRGGRPGVTPHNERGHTWHHPDAQLKEWVLGGREFLGMPAFRDKLTEQEVEVILAFIKTWWTEEQRESQADISRRYQEALEKQKKGQ